jgi:hypothetical protein
MANPLPLAFALCLGEAMTGIVLLLHQIGDGDVGRHHRANQQPDDDGVDCP